jgi:ring-1,2-phenylacetyl-CoA epoxidase subunit PaaC
MSDAFASLVLALADDELVLGHRHSEWTGWAPHIEEDVAFSSIAQDEIGHAGNLYSLVATQNGTDADALALGRAKDEYRHAMLCERPNRDWAYTLARHWVYDTADDVRLEALEGTASKELAGLVTKMRREERYHLLHADHWLRRISQGPVEGRTRLIEALHETFAEAMGLFEPVEQEEMAVKEGWLPVPFDELRTRFVTRASNALDEVGLPTDIGAKLTEGAEFVASSSGDLIADESAVEEEPSPSAAAGGRAGRHSADFDQLWDDMTFTYRNHPGASW